MIDKLNISIYTLLKLFPFAGSILKVKRKKSDLPLFYETKYLGFPWNSHRNYSFPHCVVFPSPRSIKIHNRKRCKMLNDKVKKPSKLHRLLWEISWVPRNITFEKCGLSFISEILHMYVICDRNKWL